MRRFMLGLVAALVGSASTAAQERGGRTADYDPGFRPASARRGAVDEPGARGKDAPVARPAVRAAAPVPRDEAIPADRSYGRPLLLKNCIIEAINNARLTAQVPGNVAEIPVKEGQKVARGDLLIQIYDRTAKLEYERLSLKASNQLQVQIETAKLKEMTAQYDTAKRLFQSKSMTEEDRRVAEAKMIIQEHTAANAAKELDFAKLEAASAAEMVERHKIRSPINGIVDEIKVQLGDGIQANDFVIRVVAADKVRIRNPINVSDRERIRPGMKVEAFPEHESGEILRLSGHTGRVNAIKVIDGGKRCISADDDGRIIVWDLLKGLQEQSWVAHDGAVTALVPMPGDGSQILSCGRDNTIVIWDINTRQSLKRIPAGGSGVVAVLLHPTDPTVALLAAEGDEDIRVIDLEKGEVKRRLSGHRSHPTWLGTVRDGKFILSAGSDNQLKVWEYESGKALLNVPGRSGEIDRLSISGDGGAYVFNSVGLLQIRSIPEDRPLAAIPAGEDQFDRFALFHPTDGELLAVAGRNNDFLLWQAPRDGRPARLVTRFKGHGAKLTSADFSPDGRLAITADEQGSVLAWAIPAGDTIRRERRAATITHVSQVADAVAGKLSAYAEVDNTDGAFKPGNLATLVVYPERTTVAVGN